MNEKVKRIGILLLAAFIEVIVYIVLHEGGHSFIAILCGAKITNFSILGAYMSATGGEFTQFSSSLMKVAGMAFPLVISVIYMLFGFKKKKQGEFYRTFSMLFSLVPVMSLLAWVFVPIAYMRGDTTNNDDVIQFIAISGIHPVCVMIVSAILFLLLCFIAWKKGMIQIWIDLVLSNRKVEGTVILIINTLENKQGVNWLNEKLKSCGIEYEIVHTTNMDINNCIGCNYCWLKTPGICTIKDDYEGILKKIIQADQVWIVADTHFEFISYKGKNIVDRMMPIATMNLHIKNGEMRHVIRYKKTPDFGVIYQGKGDKEYLNHWAERVALNFGSSSLGAYSMEEIQEVEHAFSNHKRKSTCSEI